MIPDSAFIICGYMIQYVWYIKDPVVWQQIEMINNRTLGKKCENSLANTVNVVHNTSVYFLNFFDIVVP